MNTLTNQRGSLLIEVLVAISLLVTFSLAIGSLVTKNHHVVMAAERQTEATALAKQSMEQSFAIKHADWLAVASLAEGFYRIDEVGSAYRFESDAAGTGETIGLYTRTIAVSPAFRDGTGSLNDSGTPDPSARRITVRVSWDEASRTKDVELTSYLTNWQGEA